MAHGEKNTIKLARGQAFTVSLEKQKALGRFENEILVKSFTKKEVEKMSSLMVENRDFFRISRKNSYGAEILVIGEFDKGRREEIFQKLKNSFLETDFKKITLKFYKSEGKAVEPFSENRKKVTYKLHDLIWRHDWNNTR